MQIFMVIQINLKLLLIIYIEKDYVNWGGTFAPECT